MRALVQRTTEASVMVDGERLAEIGPGLLVLVCAMQGDDDAEALRLARKVANLRIFRDGNGRMNRSVLDTGGAALVVSQFTLAAAARGNRPGFSSAADPAESQRLYQCFERALAGFGVPISTGQFGADMKVALVNDGPVTICLDTAAM